MYNFNKKIIYRILKKSISDFEVNYELKIKISKKFVNSIKELVSYLENMQIEILDDLYKAVETLVFYFIRSDLFEISPKDESYPSIQLFPLNQLIAIEIGISIINSIKTNQGKELYDMHDDFKLNFAEELKQTGSFSRECIKLIFYGVFEGKILK